MASPVSYDLQGQGGGIVLAPETEADSYIGNIRWIQVIADSVLETLNSNSIQYPEILTGITLPAGTGIGGNFNEIKLTSGIVIVYFA
jgi:hypothetical protein